MADQPPTEHGPVIDFRVRPKTPEVLSMYAFEGTGYGKKARERGDPPPAATSLPEFLREMDAAGVQYAVFTGRSLETRHDWKIANDHVAAVTAATGGRVIGFAGVDPLKGRLAVREADRAFAELELRGLSMDPGNAGVDVDDRRLMYPLYERCIEHGVPVVLTSGPGPAAGGYITHAWPIAVDRVAVDLPELTVVCSHAGWPFTSEMIAVAWRNKNVYFENSLYGRMPGAGLLVEAAQTVIPDKMLYASAYPLVPSMSEAVDAFCRLGFDAEVLHRILYANAAQLLGLPIEQQVASRAGT